VGVKAANAEYNAKYFGVGRGTNIYVHAADIWMPFGKPQVIGTNEEALYVIDALCHHESDLHIREHYTDTGGSTEQVFALATLLGFRFARVVVALNVCSPFVLTEQQFGEKRGRKISLNVCSKTEMCVQNLCDRVIKTLRFVYDVKANSQDYRCFRQITDNKTGDINGKITNSGK